MQDDAYLKAATVCVGLVQNYMRKPMLVSSRLDARDYYQGVCEIICFLLHLSDRLIFGVAPSSRQSRMDKLVMASLNVFVQEMRDRFPLRRPTKSEDPPEYGAMNRGVTREQADDAWAAIIEGLNKALWNQRPLKQ